MNSQKRRLDEYWHSSQAHTVLNFTRKTLPLTALPTVLFHFCRHWRVRHPEKNPAFPLLSLRKKRGKAPIVVDDPGIFRMGPINHPKKVGCAPTRRTAPCFHGSPKKVYLSSALVRGLGLISDMQTFAKCSPAVSTKICYLATLQLDFNTQYSRHSTHHTKVA